ncbi:MAG: hypothetical protein V2A58_14860 [Planctomycetota bacterium]
MAVLIGKRAGMSLLWKTAACAILVLASLAIAYGIVTLAHWAIARAR